MIHNCSILGRSGGKAACFPARGMAVPPAAPDGPVYISGAALGKGAAVWAPVGWQPAALPEEDDSHPAKLPLKIHPCRQLSDVCDGNTWKDFYLKQQNRPLLRKAGLAPGTVECPLPCPRPVQRGPTRSMAAHLPRPRSLSRPCGAATICPSLAVLSLEPSGRGRWRVLPISCVSPVTQGSWPETFVPLGHPFSVRVPAPRLPHVPVSLHGSFHHTVA